MLPSISFVSASIRATAMTTLFGFASTSVAQAAVTPGRVAQPVRPSAMWTLSHLSAPHLAPARAAVGSFGATSAPLYGPWGLTVAPNGDLYVANLLANQVLVYGTNLVQKTGNTISTAVSHPTSVAFDSTGEVYVSNLASNAITVYSSNHYLANRTIVQYVNKPVAIAIDGLNDLYVDENAAAVGLYDFSGAFAGNLPLRPSLGTVGSFAQRAQRFAFADTGSVTLTTTVSQIANIGSGFYPGNTAYPANLPQCVAFDANDNLYYGTDDPAVDFVNTSTGATTLFATLSFVPAGIAVDVPHNHVFVSDYYDNAIAVYTLSGKLVTTLH